MRNIEIAANRSIKIDTLLPEYKKQIPATHKGEDFVFSVGPVDRSVPSSLKEAIEVIGEDKVFDLYSKQLRTDLGNELAQTLQDKVTDPAKTKRRASTAIQVKL